MTSLTARREDLEARLRLYDEQVGKLAGKVDILARYARDDRLAHAARAVQAAQDTADNAARLDATLRGLVQACERARTDRDSAAEQMRVRQSLVEALAVADVALEHATAAAGVAQERLSAAEQASMKALAARQAARAARDAADGAMEALERHAGQLKAAEDHARLSKALAEAEKVAARRREALAVTAAVSVTAADLKMLDTCLAVRDQARAKRDAASVRIVVEGRDGATLSVDGTPHTGGEPLRLAHDAVLDLPGFGRLRIHPGGGVAPLARALDDAETALAAALKTIGQQDRATLADALARKAEAEREAVAQKRLFDAHAPDGLDALRVAVQALVASATPAPEVPIPDADQATLRLRRSEARTAEADADSETRRCDGLREAMARQAAVDAERAAARTRERENLLQALTSARTGAPDDRLAALLAGCDRALGLASQAAAMAEAEFAAADPETTRLELKRAQAAEAALRTDIETLTREKRDLEVELRTLGQDGFGEDLAAVEGQLVAAERQSAAQAIEADASLLLYTTLAAAQRETKERWLGPVRDRVRPYLRLIHPGSEIVLSEADFSIQHLLRDGVTEPFESLSVGAREQVAVITRLALADVLRSAGQPTAIILDDALVNTDEGRLARMHLVLQKASEHLQVLVLTCRERDFLGLGAPIHRL